MNQAAQVLAQGWIPGWLSMLVALVSALVTLDMGKRLVAAPGGIGTAWLIVSAIAAATGTWAGHTLNIALPADGVTLAYQAGGLAFCWLGGAVLAAAALRLAARSDAGLVANLAGGVLLGCALLTVQIGTVMALSIQPDIRWQWGWLTVGSLFSLGAAVGAMYLQFHLRPRRDAAPIAIEACAALVLAAGMLLGVEFALHAAVLPPGATVLPGAVSAHALQPLASLGTLTLLVMMMLSAVLDARMRRELREVKVAVANQANADPLTKLPNRETFEKQLDQRIERAELEQRRVAILHINIDGFRLVNEALGPDKADQVLRAFGQRLRGTERNGDFAGRWVGDEFVLALAGDARQMAVEQRAREMLENLSEAFDVDGREVLLTVSLGIAIFPEHGNRGTLVTHATIASRAAKNAGGATYCVFEPRLMKHAREQAEMLADLRTALANGELKLHYQPKVHAPSGKITAVEALLRWEHPKRGLVSPVEFVPIAERFGLISTIGRWVIEEACRQIHEWRQGGLRMRVGINLSVQQLREPDLADRIAAALEKYQVNPQLLTCEITESLAMKHSESTSLFFQKLGALGVHISIDDFGTGYSSLSHLRQLPAEELKIDRSFVLDLESSADARAVARAIVQLGLALNLKVVAEGVETEGQYQVLRDLGCDEVQGFLFGKPMPAAMLTIWAAHGDGDTPADFRASLYGETAPMPLRRE